MGSNGRPAARTAAAAERSRENRALSFHARDLMEPRTVLAFRCECGDPLCRDVVVLTLAEYDAATARAGAVVTPLHADVDGRDVVERTSRFCVVEEARVALSTVELS
jgi:hypothetical protein